MTQHSASYPPLDVPKPVSDGVWIVDSAPIRPLGIPMPVRMTVIRLRSGDLWLHSPTRCTDELRRALEDLGTVRHLVAPNLAHWSFMTEWRESYPQATVWAAPNLRGRSQVRKSGLQIDHDLGEGAPEAWAEEIEQTIVPGAGGYREVAFLHRSSRTLILTDLIVNLEGEKLPAKTRLFGMLTGTLAPEGKAPAYLRLGLRLRRKEAAAAAARLLDWKPERVIFSHGRWFETNGSEQLRRSLAWLTA